MGSPNGSAKIFATHHEEHDSLLILEVKFCNKSYKFLAGVYRKHLVVFSEILKASFQHTYIVSLIHRSFHICCDFQVYYLHQFYTIIWSPSALYDYITDVQLFNFQYCFTNFDGFIKKKKKFDVSIYYCIRCDHKNSSYQKLAKNVKICWINCGCFLVILGKSFFLIFVTNTGSLQNSTKKEEPSLFLSNSSTCSQTVRVICLYAFFFFFLSRFFLRTMTIHRIAEKGIGRFLFLSTTSTRSRIFRHLFATLRVIWLPRIFNCIICNHQTGAWWNLPPLGICIWMIINWMLISILLDNLMLHFIAVIRRKQAVNLLSHRLSP